MKHKRSNIKYYAAYILIYMLFILALTRGKFFYGSSVDWISQHYAIPDYFRKLFYDTGNIFPSFAPNIGAGENIYNLSYYGLFSPVILFSYLLPFVPMYIYIPVISVIATLASVFIFFNWMSRKFESKNLVFLLGLIYLLASPIMFHTHRHIMFTIYMPFLLLSLKAVEDYFAGRKKYKLVLFTFLSAMCCYFFAVTELCAITVYGVYCYLKVTDKVTFKDFLQKGSHFAGRLITAVCMSAVLILPTLHCMLSGRDKNNVSPIDFKIFLPNAKIQSFVFDTYSTGLGVFVIAAIVSAVISKDKSRRFLGIALSCLSVFPVFVYALNGFLYFDGKVMIAFIPMCIMLIGYAYEDIVNGKFNYKIVLPVTAVFCLLGVLFGETKKYVAVFTLIDVVIVLAGLLIYSKKHIKGILNFSVCGCMIFVTGFVNCGDKLVPLEKINAINSKEICELTDYINKQNEFVRSGSMIYPVDSANNIYNINYFSPNIYSSLHNKKYNSFYYNEIFNENSARNSALTIQSNNLLFDLYMSQKYLIADSNTQLPTGYEPIKTKGNYTLYENKDALPLGYATSNTISEESYSKFEYPENAEILAKYTVAKDAEDNFEAPQSRKIEPFVLKESKNISATDKGYHIVSNEPINQTFELPDELSKDELLFISFDVKNNFKGSKYEMSGDVKVTVNGIQNTLTNPGWKYYNNNERFEYTITAQNRESLKTLEILMTKGDYEISNINCCIMKYPDLNENVDPLNVDMKRTKGDNIVGDINVKNDGYFNISIPYTDGFSVKVDGEKVPCEQVDTAFLGFKISKGKHHIEINYTAPMLKEGIAVTVFGFAVFAFLIIREIIKRKK